MGLSRPAGAMLFACPADCKGLVAYPALAVPCGHKGFTPSGVWAAYAAGGNGGSARGCAPPAPPFCISPPSTPNIVTPGRDRKRVLPACGLRPESAAPQFSTFNVRTCPSQRQAADGIARREGRSPERSEGSSRSKSHAALGAVVIENPAGVFRGVARGRRRGRGPIARPLPAPEEAQTQAERKTPRPQGTKNAGQETSPLRLTKDGRPSSTKRQIPCPQGKPTPIRTTISCPI